MEELILKEGDSTNFVTFHKYFFILYDKYQRIEHWTNALKGIGLFLLFIVFINFVMNMVNFGNGTNTVNTIDEMIEPQIGRNVILIKEALERIIKLEKEQKVIPENSFIRPCLFYNEGEKLMQLAYESQCSLISSEKGVNPDQIPCYVKEKSGKYNFADIGSCQFYV